jgi:hypothetical protein
MQEEQVLRFDSTRYVSCDSCIQIADSHHLDSLLWEV